MDKKEIQKQAKNIIDKFAKALEKVNKEQKENSYIEREEFERKEGEKPKECKDFKEKLLENAPKKDKDFVLAEKGGWK